MSTKRRDDQDRDDGPGGVAQNARLTTLTGALLLVLLGLMGLTVLSVKELLPQHLFLGFLLIPPLALKLATTGYRFVRYYTGDPRYRQAGPPALLLRLLGPLVVLSSLALFVTGLELWFFGLRFGGVWVEAHKLSFMAWLPLVGIHVLGHLGETGDAISAEVSAQADPGSPGRRGLVIGSLVAGLALAVASLTYASPFIFFRDG